jgi:hypothetical protein
LVGNIALISDSQSHAFSSHANHPGHRRLEIFDHSAQIGIELLGESQHGIALIDQVGAEGPQAVRALRRQRSRLGSPKAITATAHKLARIVYHLVRYGDAYVKQTEAAYVEQVRERLERQLHRRAAELGCEVKKREAAPVASAETAE